jgi:hypothetical protein
LGGEVFLQVCSRIDESYSAEGQFVCDRREHRGVASIVSQATIPQSDGTPIRDVSHNAKRVVHAGLVDPANHDRIAGTPSAEATNPTSGSIEGYLRVVIAAVAEFRVGVTTKGHAHHTVSVASHALGDEHR